MKKLLTGLFTLWSVTTMAGLPPTTLSGQYGTAKTTFNFKTPNVQSTVTSSGGLIETGNKNLLANASFESSTVAANWTNTGGGTPAASTTNLQDGLKSVTVTSTGAWTFSQEPTLYAASKSGQEAEISIWAYSATASADLWLCPKINSVSVTASIANGCAQYTNLGLPQKLTIFPLFGSSSTGIEVKGSGAITYILDDAYLGDRRPSVLGVTTTPEVSYTPTFTGLGTVSPASNQCKWSRTGSWMKITCFFTTGTVTAVTMSMTLPNSLTIDSSKIISTNTSAAAGQKVGSLAQNGNANANSYVVVAPATSTTLLYFGNTFTGTTSLQANLGNSIYSTAPTSIDISIPILEWAGDTNSNTTRCDDPKQCETVFSANISSIGAVSGENLDWINGNCTMSSGSSVCTYNTSIFTVAPNCIAIGQETGTNRYVNNIASNTISTTQLFNSAGTGTNTAYQLICQKQGVDYTLSKTSQQIIQMRGVPSVSGVSTPKLFSAKITTTTGAITNAKGGIITSCTAANPTVCTLSGLTTTPNCSLMVNNQSGAIVTLQNTPSSSSITFGSWNSTTGVALASVAFDVNCMGD